MKYIICLLLLSVFACFASEEKPFVVLIPSFNNENYVDENLSSCVNQNYNNFRVVYINDNSEDNTLNKVEEFINNSTNGFRVELISTQERKYALSNIYETIQNLVCEDEIVVLVDGDDKLANENVLAYLNTVYYKEKPLLTYGQYGIETSKGLIKGRACPLDKKYEIKNKYRKTKQFPFSHLRTFYAWLFKKIPRKSLLDSEGNFFRSAWDLAIMYPLLEMSNGRYKYIDKILYIYNAINPISDHRVRRYEQYVLSNFIRRQKPFKPLSEKELPDFIFE